MSRVHTESDHQSPYLELMLFFLKPNTNLERKPSDHPSLLFITPPLTRTTKQRDRKGSKSRKPIDQVWIRDRKRPGNTKLVTDCHTLTTDDTILSPLALSWLVNYCFSSRLHGEIFCQRQKYATIVFPVQSKRDALSMKIIYNCLSTVGQVFGLTQRLFALWRGVTRGGRRVTHWT